MRARYYNPEIKRFINQDILIGTIADSPSMNHYAYVQGNPISSVDPFGLSPQLNWGGFVSSLKMEHDFKIIDLQYGYDDFVRGSPIAIITNLS